MWEAGITPSEPSVPRPPKLCTKRNNREINVGGRDRTCEGTKPTALEAVAFDHFATPT